jgi:AraC-like DNA-binding protein
MKKFFTHVDPVLPVQMPRVLVEAAVEHGADRERLLEGVGVSEETLCLPDARISYAQFETLEANALRLTNNPAFGLHFGRHVHLAHIGVIALAAMSSPTAGAALRVALQYYRSITPAWELELRVEGSRGLVIARATISRGRLQNFATEALIVGFQGLAAQVLGRRPPGLLVRVNYSKPAHFAEYARFLDCPILFDQDVLDVEFDASVLDWPLAGSDPAMAARAEQYCASEAGRFVSVDGLVAQMRRVLGSWNAGQPNLTNVAQALQTSPRSLRRDLQHMGTSFQELLDETRRARAEEWIRFTDMTLEQVSRQLGFGDIRSFRRAFKRWTGRTPTEIRLDTAKT